MTVIPIRDTDFEKLHDADPVDYHEKLVRLHVSCGFCENRKKKNIEIINTKPQGKE
jgi:hypothetical protein